MGSRTRGSRTSIGDHEQGSLRHRHGCGRVRALCIAWFESKATHDSPRPTQIGVSQPGRRSALLGAARRRPGRPRGNHRRPPRAARRCRRPGRFRQPGAATPRRCGPLRRCTGASSPATPCRRRRGRGRATSSASGRCPRTPGTSTRPTSLVPRRLRARQRQGTRSSPGTSPIPPHFCRPRVGCRRCRPRPRARPASPSRDTPGTHHAHHGGTAASPPPGAHRPTTRHQRRG